MYPSRLMAPDKPASPRQHALTMTEAPTSQAATAPSVHTPPVVIVGVGLAGLTTALHLADQMPVVMLAKRKLEESATARAQGGIVGVLASDDSIENHVHDTQIAGAGIVDEHAACHVAAHSADAIAWLLAQGVPFTGDPAGPLGLHLTREGGHGTRRIAHVADATGQAIHATLLEMARRHPNITLHERWMALDLITDKHLGSGAETPIRNCYGVYVLDIDAGKVMTLAARAVVLATGGVGKVYRYTTNPDTSTGDGIAMAWRAGCRVGNMEFIQFHPTCLFHPQERSFLITEALRGEGGLLKLPIKDTEGNIHAVRFMPDHDPRAELAPRDIVARAIDFEIKKHGLDYVWLDATHLGECFLKEHFPTIYQRCMELGIDIAKDPIPVVPAAHYTCGGVVTDLDGRCDLHNLYAVGEAAYTGLHGANRMASNSLLECFVYAKSAAADILAQLPQVATPVALPDWDASQVTDSDEDVIIAHNWDELRRFMWDYVGIVRTNKRLQRAQHRVRLLLDEIDEFYSNYKVSRDLIELRNLAQVAELMIRSAMARKESRGLHYTLDYPHMLPEALDTILVPATYAD